MRAVMCNNNDKPERTTTQIGKKKKIKEALIGQQLQTKGCYKAAKSLQTLDQNVWAPCSDAMKSENNQEEWKASSLNLKIKSQLILCPQTRDKD